MGFDEIRKKHGFTGTATASSKNNTVASTPTIGGSSFAKVRQKHGFENRSISTWIADYEKLFPKYQGHVGSWNTDTQTGYAIQAEAGKLIDEAALWRKQYAGDSQVTSCIDAVVDSLGKMTSGVYFSRENYAQYESEDDYIKRATENWQQRQKRYADNEKQIGALKSYLSAYLMHEDYQANPGDYTKEAAQKIIGEYEKHTPYHAKYSSAKAIERDIAALETENAQYRRGENGWVRKTVDDNYAVTLADDFAIISAKRDYTNPVMDHRNDPSEWGYDAYGVYRDAYGNEIKYDEYGQLIDPRNKDQIIEDKLGLFWNASEQVRNDVAAGNWGINNLQAAFREGMEKDWEYLTEQEKGIYYYYLDESQEKAYQYLDDMERELNRRRSLDEQGKWRKEYDEANALEKIGMNVATFPAQLLGGFGAFVSDAVDTLQGEEINPYSTAHSLSHYSRTVRGATAEDLDDTGFNILGYTLGEAYQAGMSIGDSLLARGVGGIFGSVLLSMSAAENEAYNLYKQGATADQIALGAAAAGAAELVFEAISLGNLDKIKNMAPKTRLQYFKALLVQGGVEASEEMLTEVANTVSNAFIMGSQSNWEQLMAENNGDLLGALKDKTIEVIHAGVSGFLSGGGSGAIVGIGPSHAQQKQYRNTGKTIMAAEGGVDALKELSADVASVSESKVAKDLTKQSNNVSSEIATGSGIGKIGAALKNRSNATKIGRLYDTVQTANRQANAAANQADIAKSLERNGFNTETANDIAVALVADYNGQPLTTVQSKLLDSAMENKAVQSAYKNIIRNESSTVAQRNQNMRNFADDIQVGLMYKSTGKTITEIKGGVEGLLDLSRKLKDPQLSKLAKSIQTDASAGKVGKLYYLTVDAVTEANVQDMTDALIQKGMSKTAAKKIAGAVVDAYMHNSQVSQEHAELLEALAKDTRVTETVNALLKSHEGSVWQRTNQLMNLGSYQEGAVAEATEEGGQVVSNDTGVETVTQSTVEAAAAGTFLRSSGESVRNVRIESVENGKVTVNADGRQAALEDVSFGSEAQAVMVSQVTGFAGMTAAGANTILQVAKRTDAPSGVFTEEALALYEAGMMGNESILKAAGKANIPAQMRSWIYQEGRKVAQTGTDAAQERLDQTYREAKQALEQTDEGKKSYGVTLADGITEKSMDDGQRDSYRLAKKVSAAVQVETVVYDGGTEWGYYDPNTDKIHLNINAKWSYTSMMTYTLAHELVHRAKAGSPQKFQAFADFLIKQYCKQGTSLESLINEQINAAKRMGKKMSRPQAFEEVVCDACQRLLLDTNAGQRLAEFAAKSEENRSFVKRFKQWLSKLMERLRSYYRNVEPESDAAKEFGKFDQKVKQMLADKFVDMSMDAGEKLSTIKAAGMTQKITTGEGGVRLKNGSTYDYTKSFAQQVEDYKKGLIPRGDTLIVGATPEVFKQIGFNALPMTINTTHVDYAINGTKDADHYMGETMLKQLPESIKEPVAVFISQTHGTTSVIALLNFTVNGKQVVAPITIDGFGWQNFIQIDSNAITSLYGKTTAIKQLYQAAQDEANGKFALLYANKKEAISLLHRAGHQLSGTLIPHDGFYHSIRESGSPVNMKFQDVTETQQFKRWFGDWMKHPNKASKIVNHDGTPMVVYHGTNADFTSFDKRRAKAGAFGKGFYFASSKGRASAYGAVKTIEAYLNVKSPYIIQDSMGFVAEDYQRMQKQFGIQDNITDSNINQILQSQGYDGVMAFDGNGNLREIVVFDPTQIKSATDNIGTFDGSNSDIRYKAPVGEKTFKNGQNARGEFTANMLFDLSDLKGEWWTGRYNYGILGISKTDDTEFRQFYSEVYNRTKDMDEYEDAKQQASTETFIIHDGNGREYIYSVELDGYMHGTVLSKIDKQKYEAVIRKETKGGKYGKSTADIKRRTRSARIDLGRNNPGDGGDHTSNGNPGYGGLGGRSSGGVKMGNAAGERTPDQALSDLNSAKRNKLPVSEDQASSNPYSYENLVNKPDMKITEVGDMAPTNRAEIISQAKKNAAKVGRVDPKTGSISVHVDDIDTDVVLGRDGLKHSIDRRLGVNAPVVLKAGEIISNSIRINEVIPKKIDASGAYVLIGTAVNKSGELYIVRSVVNSFSNEVTSIDVLYAINAKKEPAALLPLFTDESALGTDSTISIANLLDYVNAYFPDILPEDVLRHYGYDSRPEGDLGADALYKIPVAEDTLSEGYDTSNLDWAIEADILSEADQARFWEAIAEISKRKYNSFARTKNGGYIIENGTKMMFTDGDFKAPTLSKIIDFCYDDGHDIEEARRMIRNEAERTGRTSESLSLIERVYGSWFVAEYDIRDYPTYGRENRQGKGTNSERASSESASWGVRFEGTDSVREGQGLKKKLPVAEDLSPRALLANAAESVAQNEMERSRLLEYQQKAAQIDTQERKLRELRAQIKELSFAKGPRDQAKLKELQLEAQKTVNRINIMDKQLMRIEAFKPLQNLLAREKAAARKRAEQKSKAAAEKLRTEYRQKMEDQRKELSAKYQESRAKAVEGRKKTDLRHKIKRFKDKMQKVLDHPTDNQFVPASLFTAMVEVCELIDTDTELYKADGSLNLSQQRRNETRDRLRKLAKEYEKLGDHADPVYAGEFDKQVYDYLNMLEECYTGKTLEEMSYGELEDLYSILRSIEETVQDARRLIAFGDKADVYEVGNAIIQEQKAVTKSRKGGERSIAQKLRDKNFNATLSPMRNVARMSGYAEGSLLTKLFREFELGNRKKKRFVMESYKSFEGLTEGTEYENACSKIFGGKQYEDSEGRKFGVSKMQMMQAILSWERELANQDLSHVSKGGFVFADVDLLMKGKIAQAISNKNAYRVHDAVEMVEQFRDALKDDRWCQAYLIAARTFFNETAKNAINETGMALKHRLLATGQSYIPYEVDRNSIHREITATDSIQQTISGYGMLKSLQKKAPQPLVITGLNNIIDRHIDQVGNLYGLAVPIRNFNKVWNMKEPGTADPMVKGAVERNWGVEGVKHIEQTVMDLQGPRNRTQSEFYRKVKSGYITATFLLNLSVVFKQDGSLFAANSELLRIRNPVSMMGNLLWTIANYRKISQEVDKYTATAWERRQGVTDSELHTLMTQAKKSKLSRWLHSAPVVRSAVFHPTKWIAAMDSAVALSLWRYAKADTAKRTGLKGEALMAATAEFYDDVVEHTQSMTDVLHRPEIQKSGNFLSEAFGTFKTDLYQMAGQLEEKRGKYAANKTKKNAGALGRTVYATLTSALWTQLMTLVFAMIRYKPDRYRDEEDKEITFASVMERMAFDMAGDLLAYVFPLLGSEAVGLLEDVRYKESSVFADNLAQTAINDMVDAITTVAGSFRDGELPSQTEMRKLSTKVLQLFGVPANNILRIMDAIRLHATDIANGEFLSFNAGANRNASHHIHRVIERVEDGEMTVAKGLFEDAVDDLAGGDPEKDARDEAVSKLKTALGKKYKAGDVSAETAKEILSQAFGLRDDDIYWVMDRWDHAADEDYSKYRDFYTAVETGKDLRQVIKRYTDNGVEMEDLRGQIGQHFKKPYMAMSSGERASIKGYLLNAYELCGISREDAMTKIATWEYEAQYPQYVGTVSYGMYTKWKEHGSQAGVSMDILSKVAAYKKQDGGRDQDAVRAFIDGLSATRAQKHGLWCCFYKASTSPYK